MELVVDVWQGRGQGPPGEATRWCPVPAVPWLGVWGEGEGVW